MQLLRSLKCCMYAPKDGFLFSSYLFNGRSRNASSKMMALEVIVAERDHSGSEMVANGIPAPNSAIAISQSVNAILAELNMIASSYEKMPEIIANAAVITIKKASGITKILQRMLAGVICPKKYPVVGIDTINTAILTASPSGI